MNGGPDRRVKMKQFPVRVFVTAFIVFAIFTTVQMKVIGHYIDTENLPVSLIVTIVVLWLVAALGFTLLTNYQIEKLYEEPIETFAQTASRVANGDFTVSLTPRHPEERADYLDVVFEDFNTMVRELASIETLKTDFFSNVSHEFRTPLAAIQNYAELLERRDLPEEKRLEYAAAVRQSAGRLSSLIGDLLKLNKLEKQEIRPAPVSYDLCAQLSECALAYEDQWENKQIEFDADLEDRRMVSADESLMALVWNNLIGNAIKFTPAGGSVRLCERTEPGSAVVTVSDTGCGMDRETMAHIFDKFYQGDTSHSTQGNGLGLALVRRVLEISGGSISVDSTPGEGSVFIVRIPTGSALTERKQ